MSTTDRLPPPNEICRLGAVDLAAAIRARTFSVREVVEAFLDRIEEVNPAVNAIVSLRPRGEIVAQAEAADGALADGAEPGPLFGLPLAVKDLALTKGIRTTFGSPIFARHVPEEDEFFVARMREAGAIIIGKTNTPEFGLGSHTYNPVFGATRNAFDRALSAGGSSGGAAVALALALLPVADGSDMGGSLRNPAAWANIYGLRPSQGRVPAGPALESFVSQMGVEGAMGRSVADIALLLDVQAQADPRAPLALETTGSFLDALKPSLHGGRIGWLGDLAGHLPMEDGILPLCEAGLTTLERTGARVEALTPDFGFEKLWQAFVTLRHFTSGSALKLHYDDPERRKLLKPEAIFEVEGGRDLKAATIYDACKTRTAWYQAALKLFDHCDFLALPTAQVFPFPVEETWPKQIAGRAMSSYHRWLQVCTLATLAGLPAVSVPVGFDARGRPMGMQLIGRPRADQAVLDLAALYETVTPFGGGAVYAE